MKIVYFRPGWYAGCINQVLLKRWICFFEIRIDEEKLYYAFLETLEVYHAEVFQILCLMAKSFQKVSEKASRS